MALQPRWKLPAVQHKLTISPGHGLAPNATITAEVSPQMTGFSSDSDWRKIPFVVVFFLIFFFSLLPPPVAVRGSRRASQHPQRFANPLLYYSHQEGGCGPDRHAGRNHRHHRHHCPVAPQAGTKSRCEWHFNEWYLRGKVKDGEQLSRAACPRWPTIHHGRQYSVNTWVLVTTWT